MSTLRIENQNDETLCPVPFHVGGRVRNFMQSLVQQRAGCV